jgi:hypothetical protein
MASDASGQLGEWDRALIGRDNALLDRLARSSAPAVVYEEFKKLVTTNYKMISSRPDELTQKLPEHVRAELEVSIRDRLNAKMPLFHDFRRNLGWPIQELDIAHLRELRRSGALTLVLGAGVTVDAGGPSWAGLVTELLTLLLSGGNEIVTEKLVPRTPGVRSRSWGDHELVESRKAIGPYPEQIRAEASTILDAIRLDPSAVSDDVLKRGAQLFVNVAGSDSLIHTAKSIYDKVGAPGPSHRAIAELAREQTVTHTDGVTRGRTMGWDYIFTYNFDDLMGEALLAKALPFARMASKQASVYGDPSDPAMDEKRDLHLKVVHLHGYAPRRRFNLEGIDFVFSISQYQEHTARGKRNLIIDTFKDQFVDEPARTMLYIGCSFLDGAMNALLEEAHERFPGREHFAVLRLPPLLGVKKELSPSELETVSKEHRQRGVEPVWVRRFEEIPQLIKRLQ